MDVITALLNSDIDKEIFMEVPDGLKDGGRPILDCKLLKALCELKKSPR